MKIVLKILSLYKMETKTVKELREIAKQRGLRGYYKLRKGQLIDASLIHQYRRFKYQLYNQQHTTL